MSETNSISRDTLVRILNLVKPALSNQTFVPALTHFCVDGAMITAYNDMQAIACRHVSDIEVCVPGELFMKILGSVNSSDIQLLKQGQELHVHSGRSKLKVPTIPMSDFIFDFPVDAELYGFTVDSDFIKGLQKVLVGVGTDPSNPSHMGITVSVAGDDNALYSTDRFTITQYILDTKIEVGEDDALILPTFFCEQLVSLSKAYADEPIEIVVYHNCAVANFGTSAKLFTKLVSDLAPPQFQYKLKEYIKPEELDRLVIDLPDGIDNAIQRALIMTGSDADPRTEISIVGETMTLHTKTSTGEADDKLKLGGHVDDLSKSINPKHVDKALKNAEMIAFLPEVIVFCDKKGKFIHTFGYITEGL